MTHLIFAYGKLNEEDVRKYLRVDFEPEGDAVLHNFVKHPYGDKNGACYTGTIYAISPAQDEQVEGKLWKVDDDGLRRIDGYESYNPERTYNMYDRVRVAVVRDGELVECYAYCQNAGRSY